MNRSFAPHLKLQALLVLLPLLAGCASAPSGPAAAPARPVSSSAASPAADRWVVLIQGNLAGEMTRRQEAGAEVWTFTFNDRGRGPELTTRMVTGEAGAPISVETTGHDYFKVPMEESFHLEGAAARWSSPNESGERELAEPAFYLGTQSASPDVALLAAALRADADGRLALLPEGEARLAGTETVDVAAGGERREVTRVAISGLGFTPQGVWLDPDGSFFAVVSGWFTMIPEGWEGAAETLRAVEERADDEWAAELGARLADHPDGPVALTGAALFDPASGEVTPGRTVVIDGNRIAAVGPDGEVAIPEGARRIDATGKTVLPGLWDMHTHLSQVDGVLHLAAGVTSVRDLANDVEQVTGLRASWNGGPGVGPRVILAGFLDGPGPYAGPTKALVATEEEAREWIDRYAALGYEQIKVYSSLDPALVPAIAKAAHAHGMRLSGHVPQGLTASEAVALGFDELQHVNFLFLNFWGDAGIDTRTPARFTEVAARAAGVDLSSPEVEAFVHKLAERKIVVDPTATAFEGMFLARPGQVSPAFAAVADRFPAQVRRGYYGGGLAPPEGMEATYRESYRRLIEMVGKLYREGVPLVAGTDDLAGFTLHRELEHWVEAGIPAPEVLRIATLGAAEVMGRADRLGTLEPGKLADLIVVDGNPAEEISAIRNVELTIKDGVLFDTAKLYEAVGIRP
jgi:imidazolonepropionase-like amidohydrolase